jgi:ribonuclease HI
MSSWIRMRFKDQRVFVRADETGRLVLDADGRAEMKYRETDPKSYRPGPGNLLPDGDGPAPTTVRAPAAPKSKPRKRAAPVDSSVPSAAGGAIEIWTDGACSGNPGPMGIGVVVIDGDTRKELGEYLGSGTNNIAELVAIERGIMLAVELAGDEGSRAMRVYSDSSYAIGLLEKGWKAKANQDLVARIRELVATVPRLSFVKVAGHAGVPENERCDELARVAVSRAFMR